MAEVTSSQVRLQEQEVVEVTSAGSTVEALGGAAGVVLAIVGLAGIESVYMLAIAAVVIGATLVAQSALTASEYSEILARTGAAPWLKAGFEGELGAEATAGAAAIVLGVLGILGIHALTLSAIAAIVLGAGFLLGSGVHARLNAVNMEVSNQHEVAKRIARVATSGAIGAQVLVGAAAVILGVIALVSTHTMALALTAMLVLGASSLLSGGALGSKMASMMAR